jgi:Tol biopolymer transport system component
VIPAFFFVSDAAGLSQLFLFRNDSSVQITNDAGNDTDPRSAAGLLVFTSDRDGNPEVYISDTLGVTQRRVTSNAANDFEPALSPDGSQIVFASNRTGVPRLLMVTAPPLTGTGFPTATAIATGSDATVPEQFPVWSPDGTKLAFTSTRSGLSQVFVVAAAGGNAVQVTHESGGAFAPTWSADGSAIIYESETGSPSIQEVNVASGALTALASDSLGVGQPTCNAHICLGVTDPSGTSGSIIAFAIAATKDTVVLNRANNERQPAILVAP